MHSLTLMQDILKLVIDGDTYMIKHNYVTSLFIALCIASILFNQPVLACRLLLIVSPEQANPRQQQTIINNLLVKSRISLLNQSKTGLKKKYTDLITLEDVDGLYVTKGNPDGWGIVLYKDGQIQDSVKSVKPAYEDQLFKSTASSDSTKASDILMAHIRLASDNMSVVKNNVHPFVNDNWAFMHNGFVDLKESPLIKDRMKQYKELYNLSPQGSTDSETMFYYFLAKMASRQKELNTNNLSKQDIIQAFVSSINDFNHYSKPGLRDFINKKTVYEGKAIMSPTMNFITANGKLVMAYKQGKNLYLGMIKNKDKEGFYYIVSSEIMEPFDNKRIRWYEIPDRFILIVDKEKQNLEMFPIEYFTKEVGSNK